MSFNWAFNTKKARWHFNYGISRTFRPFFRTSNVHGRRIIWIAGLIVVIRPYVTPDFIATAHIYTTEQSSKYDD